MQIAQPMIDKNKTFDSRFRPTEYEFASPMMLTNKFLAIDVVYMPILVCKSIYPFRFWFFEFVSVGGEKMALPTTSQQQKQNIW